jgi:NAD(P)-dependent dehydrogenase (short-subunit alcohol dehydrogenase family)
MTEAGLAVVVGATGTIGQAVIRRLTRRGLPVLAVARGQDDLDKLASADELVTPCPADIGSNDAIQAIGSALTGLGGPVRMAVFAAGLPVRGSADTIDPDALAVGSNVKVGGLLRLLHAVRDRLVPGSRFVTFAGSLGLEPRAHEAGPGAVNAAVFNLMRQISLLYGPRGVTTHTLSPGPGSPPSGAPPRRRSGRSTWRRTRWAGCRPQASWPGPWSYCSTRRLTCCTAVCFTWTRVATAESTKERREGWKLVR